MLKPRSVFPPACRTRALAALFAVLSCCALSGCNQGSSQQPQQGRGGRGGMGPMVVPVATARAEVRDIPVYLSGLGSVDAFNTVNVKSRIDGQLVRVAFQEGQEVRQGDLLAEIDPRPYQVQLQQMEAALFKDQAALKDARLNLTRYQDLFNNGGVVSRQQLDTQESQVNQLEGAVRADQAQIENVKLQLTYSRITAPVSGRAGLRQVDAGNMVHASDPTPLLVITQLQPIAVIFSLPEDQLPIVAQRMKAGTLEVDAYSRDDRVKLATGKLLTIDNQIDQTTGTGKLKAVFENRDRSLWPNQFVNARLLLETKKNSTVVPVAAVQRGPQGTYVFTAKPDKIAEFRPVKVAFTEGAMAAIESGLAPGEDVVTDGQDKLQNGTRIEIPGSAPANVNAGGQGKKQWQKGAPGQ